jgi:ribosomal protein S18 acetylase RimI-like enzyme
MPIIASYIFRNETDRLKELLKILKTARRYPKELSPSDEELNSVLRKKNLVFYVALDGKKIVGGAIAHALPSVFGEERSLYVQDIAVKKNYQRKKVGTHLMKCLVMECRAYQYKNIFLQTTLSNKIAIKFFKSRKATPTQGFHFEYDTVIKVPKLN